MAFDIAVAETDEAILATYSVMSQLRPNIQQSDYVQLVRLQESEVGFRLALLRQDGQIICVAGFRLCRSLGWGKYLYVDDLVTDKAQRSHGAGKAMLDWLVQQALTAQCGELRLDSALWRNEAHRFYLRQRMDIACFHFKMNLVDSSSPT